MIHIAGNLKDCKEFDVTELILEALRLGYDKKWKYAYDLEWCHRNTLRIYGHGKEFTNDAKCCTMLQSCWFVDGRGLPTLILMGLMVCITVPALYTKNSLCPLKSLLHQKRMRLFTTEISAIHIDATCQWTKQSTLKSR